VPEVAEPVRGAGRVVEGRLGEGCEIHGEEPIGGPAPAGCS
jgi:hypothetical protein